jgi:PfaD family protein
MGQRYYLMASLPALYPEWLGDRTFREVHGTRFPYVGGAMANGISTPAMVVALGRAGMIGFFGAGGLDLSEIEAGIGAIQSELEGSGAAWGSNLIFSPHEQGLEAAVTELYIRRGVTRVSASAYMKLTPPLVRLASTGLTTDPAGAIRRRHHLLAKVSRPEVARLFMAPPPAEMLRELVTAGQLSEQEARLAAAIPLAEDVTAEADSGGHTDNRPLTVLLPTILRLRDEMVREHDYARPIRVGAAGGLGTPSAVAAAFAAGAAYVLTGSVNQAALEAGISDAGKELLVQAGMADITMAPSPDMFEMGVKVQVLKRGTMFANRAARLFDLYRAYSSLEELPDSERERLEAEVLQASVAEVWEECRQFFAARDPSELRRAEQDPRRRMALVFRWYLGRSSRWAIAGEPARRLDYQIWCGPAIGAFNGWTAGTFLAERQNRTTVQIARNLLEGAAVVTRAQQLRSFGVPVPGEAFDFKPRPLA